MRKTILAQAESSARVLSLLGAAAFPAILIALQIALLSGNLRATPLPDPSQLAAPVACAAGLPAASLVQGLTPDDMPAAAQIPAAAPIPAVPASPVVPASPAAAPIPAAARHLTIQGCLEFTEILIPGAFVIWCRPCDQVCIVILQEGVDDRAIFRVPDAPLDSPIRSFEASEYSVHRSRSGIGIRVRDAKPLSE